MDAVRSLHRVPSSHRGKKTEGKNEGKERKRSTSLAVNPLGSVAARSLRVGYCEEAEATAAWLEEVEESWRREGAFNPLISRASDLGADPSAPVMVTEGRRSSFCYMMFFQRLSASGAASYPESGTV